MPLVVPQLQTITLGGAVTGLGIESTSFRNGLPHESVLEMDVLTGAGEVVTATPDGEHADLFGALPQLLRLARLRDPAARSSSSRCRPYVALRHVRFDDADELLRRGRRRSSTTGAYDGEPVDFLDGTVVRAGRGLPDARRRCADEAPCRPATTPASRSTTARSSSARPTCLTVHDYLWRWDTDWFWCSRRVRRAEPAWCAGCGRGAGCAATSTGGWSASTAASASPTGSTAARGRPQRERVVQDVEMPVERLGRVPRWFDARGRRSSRSGCARCGCATRPTPVAALPAATPATTYVNVGFWGTVRDRPGARRRRRTTARSRPRSPSSAATSRSTPTPTTTGRPSTGSTTAPTYAAVKQRYDPDDRLTEPLREGGEATMTSTHDRHRRRTLTIGEALDVGCCRDGVPVRFTAYDGSAAGPADAPIAAAPAQPSAACPTCSPRPATSAWPAPTSSGDLDLDGRPPRRPLRRAACCSQDDLRFRRPPPAEALAAACAALGLAQPQAAAAAAAGGTCRAGAGSVEGLRHSMARDAEAIQPPLRRVEPLLRAGARPVDDLHLRVLPDRGRDARGGAGRRSTTWSPASSASSPGMRLLDVGCGWGGMVRHAAARVRRRRRSA